MTALYGVFCYLILAVIHNLDGDCSTTTECRGEGTDNAPIAYLGQFFVSGIISLLGIHIMISLKNGPRCKASIAFLVWAAAHAIWGLIGWKYGNDGTEDGKGLRIYFFLNLLAYGLHTEALMQIASLASRLWFTLFEEYKPPMCSNLMMRCLQFTLGLVTATIVGGSLWCGFTPDIWVKESLDKYPNDMDLPVHQCIQIVDIAQLVYTFASALVWISISVLFGAAANQQIAEWDQWYFVWGIPTPLAAAAVVGCQASLVFFHLLAYLVVQKHAQDEPDNVVLTVGSIAYNYANLMTGYFVHSLVCSMSIRHESCIERNYDHGEEDVERAIEISNDGVSNDLYRKNEVSLSFVSHASKQDEEEDTDRTDDGSSSSSSSSVDGDVAQQQQEDVEAILTEPTGTRHHDMPLNEPQMMPITNEENAFVEEASDDATSHQDEQQQLLSTIPLTRTATSDIVKTTLCGFSMPWIPPCLDVPPTSASAKESSLMMDFVQSMFSNNDQTFFERGGIESDSDPRERDPTVPVALEPPSSEVLPSIDCATTTIDNFVAQPGDECLIRHLRDNSTMDSMGTALLLGQPSSLQESTCNDPPSEQEETTSSSQDEEVLSGSTHEQVAPPREVNDDKTRSETVGDSDSSTCSGSSRRVASTTSANRSCVTSENDGMNILGDDEHNPWE